MYNYNVVVKMVMSNRYKYNGTIITSTDAPYLKHFPYGTNRTTREMTPLRCKQPPNNKIWIEDAARS
jgi:hypothetical protein